MSDYRVARRYAKSLLDLSIEKNVLDNIKEDFLMLDEIIEGNRELKLLLKNPVIKHEVKRGILIKMLTGKVHDITLSFIDIICRKGRESLLHPMAREFRRQYNDFKSIQVARIVTSIPLNNTMRSEFVELIKEISGKKEVKLEEELSEEIIGGFILNVGDKRIDSSVHGKLQKIKRLLIA